MSQFVPTKNPIRLLAPIGTASYFFGAEMLAQLISHEQEGRLGRFVSGMVNENLAPITFAVVGVFVLLVSYIYSIIVGREKSRENRLLNIAVVAPANFVISVGCVMTAVYSAAILSGLIFSDVDQNVISKAGATAGGVLTFWVLLRGMYTRDDELEDEQHCINAERYYYFSLVGATILLVAFFWRIIFLAMN